MKLRFAFLLTVLALLTACAALADGGWSCGGCGRWIPAALGLRCPYCGTLHEHRWLSATCTEPERCVCGETRGAPLGHDWREADCISPRACARCGLTEGETTGHRWLPADSQAPGTCAVCGALLGDVNSDGQVNTGDVLMMALYANLGRADRMDLSLADVNGDGEISARDYQALERFVNQKGRNGSGS